MQIYFSKKKIKPTLNMAIDETFLLKSKQFNVPILRLYFWKKIGFTCGVSQKKDFIQKFSAKSGLKFLTRRITGGGAVPHGKADLTLSLILPREHELVNLQPRQLFAQYHKTLADCLRFFHQNHDSLEMFTPETEKNTFHDECFSSPVANDIVIKREDKIVKITGSAQKRSRDGVLMQTSIQNVTNPDKLSNKLTKSLGKLLSPNNNYNSNTSTLTETELPDDILTFSKNLAKEKYANYGWRFFAISPKDKTEST